VEGKILIFGKEAKVLIDPRSTHSFIATPFACALKFNDKAIPCDMLVSTPLGKQLGSKIHYKDYEIGLGGVILTRDLICLSIKDYDAILGMDWLSRHYARIDCKRKLVNFCRPGEEILEFRGEKAKEENYLISGVRDRKLLFKSCTGYVAYLLN
jgi:hypothetical protein